MILVDHPAWRRVIRRPEVIAARSAHAAGGAGSVVLTTDAVVKRLNTRHRGRGKPTNVLTFDPPGPGQGGDIVLAFQTVLREARAAGKHPGDHLAHLVVHGALHLRGLDHHGAGDARRMEMAESRILGRLGRPNPWKRS